MSETENFPPRGQQYMHTYTCHFVCWPLQTKYTCSYVHLSTVDTWSSIHYNDVIISETTSQITGVLIVYSTVCSGTDQRKYQSSASLAFVRGIHRWPVDSPHKGPVTRKMFPFNDVIMSLPRYHRIRWMDGHVKLTFRAKFDTGNGPLTKWRLIPNDAHSFLILGKLTHCPLTTQ